MKNGSFNIDDLIQQVMDFENGSGERELDPESYLYLTALITPINGVSPQCYNDSLTYVRALNNLTNLENIWALKSEIIYCIFYDLNYYCFNFFIFCSASPDFFRIKKSCYFEDFSIGSSVIIRNTRNEPSYHL